MGSCVWGSLNNARMALRDIGLILDSALKLFIADSPDTRIIAIPDRPIGVAQANIVSGYILPNTTKGNFFMALCWP